ncbi:uncharacterized protein PADG_12300 [Paracoccidioides brasiliensis Pb18]|uniref:Uncharacterized protein n=1 Tax=Paracoccidioides brasiliensis (strain Pb18) TaxID=502780 RepID=A0A0A0HUC2_PARBD|nr:uncharacterized protein PADG_12300 [Paracoccidioides brasiliensis Pb18]KGM91616.1 hypothetical protein PADG_12300 [Paracoccidioides brasiliensis Pb18]
MEECRVTQNCVLMLAKQHEQLKIINPILHISTFMRLQRLHPTVLLEMSSPRGNGEPTWEGAKIVSQRNEYHQALSQVNFYMNQHNSRYGFLVTNQELVAIRKLDENGNLELAQPILWTTGGTATQPRLTVMLALWYIGMLASHDQGVNNWQM